MKYLFRSRIGVYFKYYENQSHAHGHKDQTGNKNTKAYLFSDLPPMA